MGLIELFFFLFLFLFLFFLCLVNFISRGVCISDMIPYYLGRMFRKTKASEDICTKVCGRCFMFYGSYFLNITASHFSDFISLFFSFQKQLKHMLTFLKWEKTNLWQFFYNKGYYRPFNMIHTDCTYSWESARTKQRE